VRGYLFGSVYEEYRSKQTAAGVSLQPELQLAEKLPAPIFTPSTKAETGHDENINYEEFIKITGKDTGDKIISHSIEIYKMAQDKMKSRGILLADTKFEFGLDPEGKLILVDEVLTPDSSRYWEAESYKTGESPKSFDKQFVRDYLLRINWDKKPPAPQLPEEIITKTYDKYVQINNYIQTI
jgi:phosphoribosylaminoimidazole-succinocarboxamide synthase